MLHELWDVEEPIEGYFKQMKKCVEFASDALDADDVTPKMQMQIMLPSMEWVGEFKQHVREWKRITTKTPELFRTHFIEAYEEMLNDEAGEEMRTEEANNVLTSEQLQQILNSVGVTEAPPEHANMSTDTKLLELIERLTKKVSALESKGDSKPNQRQRPQQDRGRMAWRREAPKEGELLEKTVDGKKYKHCGTCRKGEGLWTTGAGLHGTPEHDPERSRQKK